MRSDSAMWASRLIAEHLRAQISLEDARTFEAGRTLAMLADLCQMDVGHYWKELIGETAREYLPMIVEQACGRLAIEFETDFHAQATYVIDALDSRSWEKMRVLPDSVWLYVSAATGMSLSEWDCLPDFCRRVLSEPVSCPDCRHTASMSQFGRPEPISDPFEFMGSKVCLVFSCPSCGTRVTYDIKREDSEEFARPLIRRSKPYRWAVIAIFVVIIGSFIAAMIKWTR